MIETLSIAFILFISGLIHGLVGFAFALTALPLLALFKSVKFAVPLLSLFSFTVNLIMLLILKEKRIFKIPLLFFIVIVLGIILGVKGFVFFSEGALRIILFIAIFLYFFWEILQWKRGTQREFVHTINPKLFSSPLSLGIAFLVGLLGGLLNTPGPPIVIYLALLNFDKNLFKATLQLIFTFTALVAAINHYLADNLSIIHLRAYFFLLPVVILGLLIGQKFYTRISTKVYYHLVNIFLVISALLLIFDYYIK